MGFARAEPILRPFCSPCYRACSECAGGEHDDPPPADATQQVGVGIGGSLGMAADLVVKLLRDDQALPGTWFCSERGGNEGQRIAQRRLRGRCAPERGRADSSEARRN